jgi:serine-type D-Ala-D-Ala carboxypeptidase (penicillin-binding protein 5/6)
MLPSRHPTRPAAVASRVKAGAVAVLAAFVLLAAPVAARADRLPSDVVGTQPIAGDSSLTSAAPDISAAAGILVTADGRVLWSRRADVRRAMASTTKIMTALVVLDRAKLSDVATVPKAAEDVAQSPVNLTAGERLTVGQLLDIMLVESANDAAYTLAVHVGGSISGFADLMNDKAASLGMLDTHYVNPHGLDAKGHYTSAADLALLARTAMANADFRRMVRQRSVSVPGPDGEKRVFESTDSLLRSGYEGLEGIKTGFTNDAGYCLVSAAKRNGVELFGVILGASSDAARFTQTSTLLDWGFKHYRRVEVIESGVLVGTVPATDWLDKDIVATVGEGTSTALFDLAGRVRRTYRLEPSLAGSVATGQPVGSVAAYQGGQLLATEPVVASRGLAAPGFWDRLRIWTVRAWRSLFGPREVRASAVTVTD